MNFICYDYSEGPIVDALNNQGEMWVFGKDVKGNEIYIKITLGKPNNIIVSAIVGKNGSGKSTLLEMIFRIVNNVNSYICSHLYKDGIPPTFYVDGIRAKLSYTIDENNYEIVCDRFLIQIFQTDNGNQLIYSFDCRRNNAQLRMDISSRTNLMSKFFYIIGINYSPLAYNEHDYSKDWIYSINNRHERC